MVARDEKYQNAFVLRFAGSDRPELIGTEFQHSVLDAPRVAVRGKSVGAYQAQGSFQWTRAVVALAALSLREKIASISGEIQLRLLVGAAGSLAASLDDSVTKNTVWVLDMFGVDSSGQPIIRRCLRRSNSGRKYPGPTAIALNESFLPANAIEIEWEGTAVEEKDSLRQLLSLVEREGAS